ncbi:hypothetical protein [Gordonia sp. i37]|nr:hypothetical protein [Gordonia sp. i37]
MLIDTSWITLTDVPKPDVAGWQMLVVLLGLLVLVVLACPP